MVRITALVRKGTKGGVVKTSFLLFISIGVASIIFVVQHRLKMNVLLVNDNNMIAITGSAHDDNDHTNTKIKEAKYNEDDYDPNRLCTQNQYAKSLSLPLSNFGNLMDKWLHNKIVIERDLTQKTIGFPHNHDRFDAFEVMGDCNTTCIGGQCNEDLSKITCRGAGDGEGGMKAPCVVYSIGGNNQWDFEIDLLDKTPCEVHTFDCTGPISRFQKPENDRLHFHHVCLGQVNKPAPPPEPHGREEYSPFGEFWTLKKMQKTLNHTKIDLFKVDIEGYEWPMFEFWPENTDRRASDMVIPMQVLVEVHYQSQMPELSTSIYGDFKFSNDMIHLQAHLLKMGYAVIKRDNNQHCTHCTELTLVRIRCPEDPADISITAESK